METKDMDELQKAADYYAFRKSVQSKGTASIVLGILGILFGLLYVIVMSPVNLVLVFLGIILLAVGFWTKIKPNAQSLLISGVGLCIMGAWNLVVVLINFAMMFANPGAFVGFSPLGIFWAGILFIWGVEAFNRYRRFSLNPVNRPDKEWLKRVEDVIKPIQRGNMQKDSSVIEFKRQGGWSGVQWKGQLSQPYGVVTSVKGDDIFLVKPDEMAVEETGKSRGQKKVRLKIKGSVHKGIMNQESINRIDLWKNATSTGGFH